MILSTQLQKKRGGAEFKLFTYNIMNWITFAILAASSFGFYNYFVRLSADKLSPTIALMFIAGTSFLVAAISTLVLKLTGQNLTFSKSDITFPMLAGLCTGIAEILYLVMFSKNPSLSIGTPLVIGGTMLVATVLGIVILKEPVHTVKIAGIFLTICGIALLTRA